MTKHFYQIPKCVRTSASSSVLSFSFLLITTNAFYVHPVSLLFCQSHQVNISQLLVIRVNHCKAWWVGGSVTITLLFLLYFNLTALCACVCVSLPYS